MKPLCFMCVSRHESYQGHVFGPSAVRSVVNALKSDVVNARPVVNAEIKTVVNAVVNALVKNPDRHKDKEGRRAYLRDYMKVRRAIKSGRAELLRAELLRG